MKRVAIAVLSPIILALLAAAASGEQTPAPSLTSTERIALHSVSTEYAQIRQELAEIEADIAKSHPGFHLDPENPLSGQLIPDVKPPAPVAAPAKK